MSAVTLCRTDSSDADFVNLYGELNAFLAILDGDQHAFFSQFNKVDSLATVVLAYQDGKPVGCGAFRSLDPQTIEVKRMFVDPDARGKGVGEAVLRELERWAIELGHSRAILETSRRLEPAMRLYHRSGFTVIPNYGPYVDVKESVCLAKSLSSSAL